MSGSRFPPRSDDHNPSGTSQATSNMAATVQHLRQYLNSRSSRSQVALDAVEREMLGRAGNGSEQRPERRNRSAFEIDDFDSQPTLSAGNQPPFDPFVSAIDSLPTNQRDAALSGLRRAVAHLAEASTNLTNNLARSFPQSRFLEASPHQASSDSRTKRRKLNAENRQNTARPNYGHFGQVVPGTLQMEIDSCDGGRYEPDGEHSWPQNVLVDDESVYCTKSDRCNLVLRHQGETPFCLNKLVINAPKLGFDAPLQQGMVFVSMTSDDLLARTAQYQVVYTPRRRRRRRPQPRSSNALMDFGLGRGVYPRSRSRSRTRANQQVDSESDDIPPLVGPDGELIVQPRRRVTTNFEENTDEDESTGSTTSSEDDGDPPAPGGLQGPLATLEPVETDSDDSGEERGYNTRSQYLMRREMRRTLNMLREQERRRLGPSSIEPVSGDGHLINDVGESGQREEVLKPHARFFIERGKSSVSIKFDPPASGRYILIKLWSPYRGGNIDIQSIVAHGFAGPRYFPSLDVR